MLYLELFMVFVRIGMCSFGGMSMIPVINQEMLSHGWMTLAEVSDIVAIAEMTPGSLGINCATFVGMRTAGIPGALCATGGVLVPSMTLCFLAAVFIERVKGNAKVSNAMYGIRPVCIGLILYTLLTLAKTNFLPEMLLQWKPLLISVIIGVISWKTKWGVPILIVIAGILGVLIV